MQDVSLDASSLPQNYCDLYEDIAKCYDYALQPHQHLLRIADVLRRGGEQEYDRVPADIIQMVVTSLKALLLENSVFSQKFQDEWLKKLPKSLQDAVYHDQKESVTLPLSADSSLSSSDLSVVEQGCAFSEAVLLGIKQLVSPEVGQDGRSCQREYDATSRMLMRDVVQLATAYEEIYISYPNHSAKRVTALLVLSENTPLALYNLIKYLFKTHQECSYELWMKAFVEGVQQAIENAQYEAQYPAPKSDPRSEQKQERVQPRRRFTLPTRQSKAPSQGRRPFFARRPRAKKNLDALLNNSKKKSK